MPVWHLRWLAILLFSITLPAWGQSELACKIITVDMEARGESLRVAKSVLQVVENRMRMDKMTACQVVKRKGAFPWARKKRNWKLTKIMLTRHFELRKMMPVVNIDTYYFNDLPVKHGRFHKKLGGLYFHDKEKKHGC